ncbi:MAG: hypothetical protein DRJ02_09445 [Bacteroidetes bacterium]|nr:MAG: hypothetical protein DRI72_06010 [Bacteroidota bacterium]RLD85943.1 MAG: hypothetical protein DRJ02_09445 [Bacteroidota bacterium]
MMKNFFLTLLLILVTVFTFAGNPDKKGVIKGVIRDSITNQPVEFATIAVYKAADQSLVDGAITGETGDFKIRKLDPGTYYLEITFIGYKTKRIENITISKDAQIQDLNEVHLSMTAENLAEVEITAGTPSIEYQIDKKVIHVDKQITATAGTAVDILETVPSINVDAEGNVTLRGSSGFQVFIDGKPSILDPNDVLQQIPASAIADIEIITNPSAKYDPDGTAGIINIKMKKIRLEGFNGIINASVGTYGRYGGDFLFNYRKNAFNIYFGADYNKRVNPGYSEYNRDTYVNDSTFKTVATGDFESIRISWGVRGGVEINPSKNDYINIGGRLGYHERTGTTNRNYDEWIEPGDIHNPYLSYESSFRSADFYSVSLDYSHSFKKDGHSLTAQVIYDHRISDELNKNELLETDSTIRNAQQSTEKGPAGRLRVKLDYTLPIGENDKFETGFQSRNIIADDDNKLYNYDPDTDDFILIPEYSNMTDYKRDIYALYAIYSGKVKNFGYQAGLRGEYTYRRIKSENNTSDSTFIIDRMDFFPSVHLSYDFLKENSLMASYTRRIERPRGWYLEPFITVKDAFNLSKGNPDLEPEYIDSYEMAYQKRFKKNFFSLEAYYRITHNKIERVSQVYQDNIMLHTYENVGKDYSLGGEMMLSVDLWKWWHMDISGNLYYYRVTGTLYDQSFDNNSTNWRGRLNNTFYIAEFTKFQLSGSYSSPTVTAQGKRYGYYMINAALKQDFFQRKLSLTLSGRNLFGTANYESLNEGPDFSNHFYAERKSPMVTLTVSFKLNNYKVKRVPTSESYDTDEDI